MGGGYLALGFLWAIGCNLKALFAYLCAMKKKRTDRQRLNSIWWGMRGRCYDRNHIAYKDYGGRGIKMCKTWKDSFDVFFKWALSHGYETRLTIDRYPNNDGNYSPQNCRWATMKQQGENRRVRKDGIDYGEGGLLKLAAQSGIKYPTLQARFRKGWNRERAIDNTSNFKINNVLTSKPIIQMDMHGNIISEYPSIKEAERQTQFKKPMLIHHLKGRRKHAYGFLWKYK